MSGVSWRSEAGLRHSRVGKWKCMWLTATRGKGAQRDQGIEMEGKKDGGIDNRGMEILEGSMIYFLLRWFE